ncbi:MAG: glutathione-disulfide reductase, partial [Gammaproteobacteria bacterium]
IHRLNHLYQSNLNTNQVTLIEGKAQLINQTTIGVHGDRLSADHILVATGGYPSRPDIPGAELGLTSDDFFELESPPRRVAVVGAGYIAVELSSIFNALGCDTELFLRHERPLRSFDSLLGNSLIESFNHQGIRTHSHTLLKALKPHGNTFSLKDDKDQIYPDFDQVFWATGRTPNTRDLGLEEAGVELTPTGHIQVNSEFNTNVDSIFAVGDVTLYPPLTPVAIACGRYLADRLFGASPALLPRTDTIPTAIFSHPPAATVGLSEHEAVAQYGRDAVLVKNTSFKPMYYGLSRASSESRIKVILLKQDQRLLGFHMVGKDADEIIQGMAVAINAGATFNDLRQTIAVHPTSAEEIVLLK